jgi:hypothetical protein
VKELRIADYLNNAAKVFAWVQSKQPIYATNPATPHQQRRVDFVISDINHNPQYLIELKCRRDRTL